MFKYIQIHSQAKTQSDLLNDMINHTKDWESMMVRGSLTTSCHECSHMASAEIRNKNIKFEKISGSYMPQPIIDEGYFGEKHNGFYLFNNLAYKCLEPNIRKSDAAQYVHSQLKGFRYKTYITGQTAWDDQPLYIVDEWNAYIAGAECAIEVGKKGITQNKGTDISSGPMEFLIYSCALILAIKKKDPEYFNRQVDFMQFFNHQYKRAVAASSGASEIFPWDGTKKLLDAWNSPICKEYRDLLQEDFKPITPEDVEGI